MRAVNAFKAALLASAFFITTVLVLAVGALFMVPSWEDIAANLFSEEMRFSLRLTMVTGVVSAQFFTALPYAIRIMKSTFDYINPRMEFVSRSLGYGPGETFLRVSLPMARSGILAAAVIAFARCIGTFGTVLILAGGSYMKTETLPIALYLNISYGNMGMALTSGLVLVAVSFIAIFIFEKTEVPL